MFMRYRGGGIGHTYMRAIEQIYENMSRERIHHKVRKHNGARPDKDVPMGVDGADGVDDEDVGEATDSQASQDAGSGGEDDAAVVDTSGAATLAGDVLDDDNDSDDNDGDEYIPDSDLRSSGISDSDDLDSDENGGGYESYGLGDLD